MTAVSTPEVGVPMTALNDPIVRLDVVERVRIAAVGCTDVLLNTTGPVPRLPDPERLSNEFP
jgi:hypothetical protein